MRVNLRKDWLLVSAAAWLLVSPFILGFAALDRPAAWLAIALGVVLLVVATQALALPPMVGDWAELAIGAALMASPWAVGFRSDGAAALDFVLVGFVVTAFALGALGRDLHMEEDRQHAVHR